VFPKWCWPYLQCFGMWCHSISSWLFTWWFPCRLSQRGCKTLIQTHMKIRWCAFKLNSTTCLVDTLTKAWASKSISIQVSWSSISFWSTFFCWTSWSLSCPTLIVKCLRVAHSCTNARCSSIVKNTWLLFKMRGSASSWSIRLPSTSSACSCCLHYLCQME